MRVTLLLSVLLFFGWGCASTQPARAPKIDQPWLGIWSVGENSSNLSIEIRDDGWIVYVRQNADDQRVSVRRYTVGKTAGFPSIRFGRDEQYLGENLIIRSVDANQMMVTSQPVFPNQSMENEEGLGVMATLHRRASHIVLAGLSSSEAVHELIEQTIEYKLWPGQPLGPVQLDICEVAIRRLLTEDYPGYIRNTFSLQVAGQEAEDKLYARFANDPWNVLPASLIVHESSHLIFEVFSAVLTGPSSAEVSVGPVNKWQQKKPTTYRMVNYLGRWRIVDIH